MRTVTLFLTSALCLSTAIAQTPPPKKKTRPKIDMQALQAQIKRDQQRIRELLGVDMLHGLDKRFEQLMERFYKENGESMGQLDRFFQDENFDKFMDLLDPYEGLADGEAHWMETPKDRILILKMKVQKDQPMDIQIKDGQVRVSGKNVQENKIGGVSTRSVSEYKRIYAIPEDVEIAKAQFDNKDGEVQVRFPKKVPGRQEKDKRPARREEEIDQDLRPVAPEEGDITI